ncbi:MULTISPECIES: GNAT family N-acetyltransferase [unclassified Curtobacterium]|uniref:GNAT family N-acetyltransferase n=1 Tax=unclassified Curtobacterium TaxID=257496 RepID=UPI001C647EBF|nr:MULTISPECIES: GNAT family N-acetyltransferase [unclassified Curtobacterium]WIB67987.1 GNAT family N-acetyltransferase [Curtobacterium sp. MCBD17_035]
MSTPLTIRRATLEDAATVADLVERAYRGEASREGWTSEVDVIGGRRTDTEQIRALIAAPHSVVFVGVDEGRIIATCQVQRHGPGLAYFGTFAVEPTIQGRGLGRRMMEAAAEHARTTFDAAALEITVVAQQSALIAWYRRLGFVPTGATRPFPAEAWGATPLVPDVHFVVMRKPLSDRDEVDTEDVDRVG